MMGRRDTKIWAREELLGAIDDKIKDLMESRPINGIGLDEEVTLKAERDRVARLFHLRPFKGFKQ